MSDVNVVEDVTDSGDIIKGNKVDYKNRIVKPVVRGKVKNDKSQVLEAMGYSLEYAEIDEEHRVEYDTFNKIATMYVNGEATSICRVTNSEWNSCCEEVCNFLLFLDEEASDESN